MSSSSATVVSSAASKPAVEMDPAIAALIRDPAAPEAVPTLVHPPSSIPGEVGFGPMLTGLYGYMRHGIAYGERLRVRFGDVNRGMWAAVPCVMVWDADEVQRIVRNEDGAWSTAMGWDMVVFDRLDTRSGNLGSLLSLDFDRHRAARKVLTPAFTSKAVKGYIDLARPRFRDATDQWLKRGEIDFKPEVRRLLAHVASDIFTGFEDPQQVARLEQALEDFWHGPLALLKNPLFSPRFRRAQRGFKFLRETFLGLIPERRARPGRDLFSHLCQVEDRGGLDDEAMVRVFVTIMFGAFDTTSLGVTSMIYFLAKHPEWQERLRAEVDALGDSELDPANLAKLEQLEWVWKESLRLMPVSGGVPRRPLRAVKVGGYELPAGTFVIAMSSGMGRQERWWSDPLKFDPLRFSPERAEDKRHPSLFLPFGAGAHACIGAQLANIEVKLLVHHMLRRCRFELAQDYDARHTLTPLGCVSGNVRIRVVAR